MNGRPSGLDQRGGEQRDAGAAAGVPDVGPAGRRGDGHPAGRVVVSTSLFHSSTFYTHFLPLSVLCRACVDEA